MTIGVVSDVPHGWMIVGAFGHLSPAPSLDAPGVTTSHPAPDQVFIVGERSARRLIVQIPEGATTLHLKAFAENSDASPDVTTDVTVQVSVYDKPISKVDEAPAVRIVRRTTQGFDEVSAKTLNHADVIYLEAEFTRWQMTDELPLAVSWRGGSDSVIVRRTSDPLVYRSGPIELTPPGDG